MLNDVLATVVSWEGLAVALAVAYLVLVIVQNIWCWAAAMASTLIYLVLFFQVQLYMESALQIFYAAMAVYGWLQWRRGGQDEDKLPITLLGWRRNAYLIAMILATSALFGWLMSFTNAALPWADSFTTVGAIVATWMVARKIFENWAYWFVIDSVSIYLYISRGLPLTALLFVAYLVLIVIGARQWWLSYQKANQAVT